jgi:hypothetical protein
LLGALRAMGDKAVIARRQNKLYHFVQAILIAGVSAAVLVASSVTASAQSGGFGSIFDGLFNRRTLGNGTSAFADPFGGLFGSRPAEQPRPEMGSGVSYCVRLCDGRFFPIQQHGNVSPAQACSSFCPASQTKIYNGSSIDNASATDGKRYADLPAAFVYREKIVPGCTCNGKDAFGLVNTPIEEDATLQAGDIVATNAGLMAYNGGTATGRRQASNFTPISSYSGLSSDLRRKLTETKIAPATEAPAPVAIKPVAPADGVATARSARNKRVQADR